MSVSFLNLCFALAHMSYIHNKSFQSFVIISRQQVVLIQQINEICVARSEGYTHWSFTMQSSVRVKKDILAL